MIAETEFEFGATLRNVRLSRGLTQTALGELTGIPQNRISNWELGYHLPDLNDLRRLCVGLNCPPGDLLQLSSSELSMREYDMVKLLRQLDEDGWYAMEATGEIQLKLHSKLSNG